MVRCGFIICVTSYKATEHRPSHFFFLQSLRNAVLLRRYRENSLQKRVDNKIIEKKDTNREIP